MRLPLLIAAATLAFAGQAAAREFSWAATTDPQTMDPHAVNSAPVLGFLNNVYEGLVRRGRDMRIEPALATSWEPIGAGEGWRFILRRDVTFHDGSPFDATDVVFSYNRASGEAADTRSWFAPVSEVIRVDDYTVDIMTSAPNPIFPDSIANWMIMDSDWADANNSTAPDKERGTFASLNTNGTGPFRVTLREPGLRTVLEPFDGWWDSREHNLTRAEFTPIQNPATAVAALLSGDISFINPVPVQDAARLAANPDVNVIRGTEARVIMLGFAHAAPVLKYSDDVTDANPFADARVREAVARSISVNAILETTMRGSAEAAGQLVSPAMRGYSRTLDDRPGYDPDRARALLADAGYPDGFSFGFRCPNDRYLNDEAVCQAITAMLAKTGLRAGLDAMPVQNYWPELRAGNFDMYLLGWSPGTFDAEHPLRFLVATPDDDKKLGSWNFGGFSNTEVDTLLPLIRSELDETRRQAMLDVSAGVVRSETAYIPLYVQPLIWGVARNIDLTQRPDDFFMLRWVTVN
ncbi:ABC transporter substrate-binding protein [Roseobacter ponti]|uniref:ABC transporter substrate-binding protein n=1 Tax=Roseobacter ponti TaxID=1891787 RepID=A0A858SZN5_9RHOB|nr:ABC transporter substrate-binding protein [Roseobacter ponti]QJF53352.1 ABC transporter substrate-binding protein [Roseobacter ponti]